MNTKRNLKEQNGAAPLDAAARLFSTLPLGTRFRYVGGDDIWVILEKHGCGLIARWDGIDGPVIGQTICSLKDSQEAVKSCLVIPCEANAKAQAGRPTKKQKQSDELGDEPDLDSFIQNGYKSTWRDKKEFCYLEGKT